MRIMDKDLSAAELDVLIERDRQRIVEGWTPAHDDHHTDGKMAHAAASYALWGFPESAQSPPQWWPWAREWWKPTSRRRSLVKAGALIIAEIERLDRAEKAEGPDEVEEQVRSEASQSQ